MDIGSPVGNVGGMNGVIVEAMIYLKHSAKDATMFALGLSSSFIFLSGLLVPVFIGAPPGAPLLLLPLTLWINRCLEILQSK